MRTTPRPSLVLAAARGKPVVDWETKRFRGEVIEYLDRFGVVVLTRPRCPALRRSGERCERGIGEGYSTCWTHRKKAVCHAQ